MSAINWNPAESEKNVTGISPGPAVALGAVGVYVNSKNIRNHWIEANFTYGADVDTVVSVYEADDTIGTNEQEVTEELPIWYNVDIALSHDWLYKEAATHTFDAGDGKNQKAIIQIDPAKLTAGKPYVAVRIGPSDVLNSIQAVYRIIPRNFCVDLLL